MVFNNREEETMKFVCHRCKELIDDKDIVLSNAGHPKQVVFRCVKCHKFFVDQEKKLVGWT